MYKYLDIAVPVIEAIHCDLLTDRSVSLNVLRLDKIHPTVHGNKWFKLKGNIEQIRRLGLNRVVSFGGAYSNHIYALAAVGELLGFETTGFIRGEIVKPLNPVLAFASRAGMKLISLSRADYRRKHEPEFLRQLLSEFGECYVLPEGGSNLLAVRGCEEIVDYLRWNVGVNGPGVGVGRQGNRENESTAGGARVVALSCGTGATIAGIISGLNRQPGFGDTGADVIGVSVVNAKGYIANQVEYWLGQLELEYAGDKEERSACNWRISEQYHGGGYGKISPQLKQFMAEFTSHSQIPIEGVYTGKLFMALFDMIRRGVIPAGSEVLALHTGGIISG